LWQRDRAQNLMIGVNKFVESGAAFSDPDSAGSVLVAEDDADPVIVIRHQVIRPGG